MKLDCILLDERDVWIEPAPHRRVWMDETPQRFAYRCLPLSHANSHGWILRCPGSFRAEWNGGAAPSDVQVVPMGDGPVPVEGHFGSGIFTITIGAFFRTDRGYNLWVGGAPNFWKDGAAPLTGVVETDWIPFPFTMNWKITRPNTQILFRKGDPFCFIFPLCRGVVEAVEPAIRSLEDDPPLKHLYEQAHVQRSFTKVVEERARRAGKPEKVVDPRARYQGWYMRGEMPDGSNSLEDHERTLRPKPFRKP